MIRHISDRVVVMYLGRVVESAPTAELYATPNHPYTEALIAEVPQVDARRKHYVPIRGEIPSRPRPDAISTRAARKPSSAAASRLHL